MICVESLYKSFRWRGGLRPAVQGVSFHVAAGEVFGLLGPNGAGKTTTLRMVMGLLEPDGGSVRIGGDAAIDTTLIVADSSRGGGPRSLKRQLGMISTNDGVYPYLTAREILQYFADLYAVPLAAARSRIDELSRLLDFGDYLDQRCNTLSTGQRQRVILARGLMHDPPAMLLDEPTRGLDVIGSRTVFDFIDLLRRRGKAILLSTHRLDEAERLCDRFGLLHHGALVRQGTLAQLREETGREHLVDMFLDLLDRERDLADPVGSAVGETTTRGDNGP